MEKLMDLLVYFWPQKWQKMAGFSIENLQILEGVSIYLGGGDIWFFHGPSSAVNFECQLLSKEPDHDYETEKLCKGFF